MIRQPLPDGRVLYRLEADGQVRSLVAADGLPDDEVSRRLGLPAAPLPEPAEKTDSRTTRSARASSTSPPRASSAPSPGTTAWSPPP